MQKPSAGTIGKVSGSGTIGAAILYLLIEFLSSGPANARQDEQIKENRERCEKTQEMVKNKLDKIVDVMHENTRKLERALTLLGER